MADAGRRGTPGHEACAAVFADSDELLNCHSTAGDGIMVRMASRGRKSGGATTKGETNGGPDRSPNVAGGKLIPDTAEAREVIAKLGSKPVHVKGDTFEAKPRPNVPEREKPTPAQQRARRTNIKKAQAARHAHSA